MGEIVGATLCAHVPRLMMSDEEKKAYMGSKVSTLDKALEQMREDQIKDLAFDTFLIFDTHWPTTTNFYIDSREWHGGFYTSDEVPEMIHDYEFLYLGDPELAQLIVEEADQGPLKGRVRKTEGGKLGLMTRHYPTLVTMRYLNPDPGPKKLVLPMSIAYTSSIQNELDYGEAIARAVKRSNRRVVLVATGGLSHKFHSFDTIPSRTSPDAANIYDLEHLAADVEVLWLLEHGMHEELLRKAETFREKSSPEGNFAHYLRMVGVLGGYDCEIKAIQYGEYESAIGTGQVVLWFPVQRTDNKTIEDKEVHDATNS